MAKPDMRVEISIEAQQLRVIKGGTVVAEYPVSTAKNGVGEQSGSECTPRGRHRIRAKIGGGLPSGTVFVGRRETGEIYSLELGEQNPERDWILSRILWLSGLEPGVNRFGKVDTFWRYIYLHGCPDELINGTAESHGCVRMRNEDIIELFDLLPVGAEVVIASTFTGPETW